MSILKNTIPISFSSLTNQNIHVGACIPYQNLFHSQKNQSTIYNLGKDTDLLNVATC